MTISDFSFRLATWTDHTYLAHLFWLTACYGDSSRQVDDSYGLFRAAYVDDWDAETDGGVIVLDSFGFPVGGCWLRYWKPEAIGCANLGPDVPELAIAVEPHVNGRGLGRALLTQICDLAAAQGAKQIALHVDHENVSARGVYERFGFQVNGTDPHDTGLVMTFRLADRN